MIIHNVEQGSNEWAQFRLAIPTASGFDKIITPTGKASTQAKGYADELLANLLCGHPVEDYKNEWIERGNELEAEAVNFYEMAKGVSTEKIGFVTNDETTYGASPDRLVGEDGLLEVKCPKPKNHVAYLINQKIDQDYYPQLQGQLMVMERQWVDIISYHPEMPPCIVRVERDEAFIGSLKEQLNKFIQMFEEKRKVLIDAGHLT